MTVDEISSALEKINLVDPSKLPKSVSKEDFDKVSSELASAKKQLKEKMSDAEKAAADQKARLEEFEALKKENSVLKCRERFLTSGYDAKTSAELAEAFANGDMETFAKISDSFMETQKKAIEAATKAKLLKDTPTLHSGGTKGKGDGDGEENLGKQIGEQQKAATAESQSIFKEYGLGGI